MYNRTVSIYSIEEIYLKKNTLRSPGRDGDCSQCKRETVCPNLAYLMQQIQSRPRERGDDRAFISINDGENSKRVFPFQSTPSGNLKILPNQVNVPIDPPDRDVSVQNP